MMKKLLTLTFTLAALALLGTISAVQAAGASPQSREYMIKAAFLYNFAKYTDWPAQAFTSADAPLRFCILGRDPFGPALDIIKGKRVQDHPLEIRLLSRSAVAATCHILFVSASETDRLPLILGYLRHRPVLTVSDTPGFVKAGGIINLTKVGNKVRFEINREVVQASRLTLRSQLLGLAVGVPTRQQGSGPQNRLVDAPRLPAINASYNAQVR